MGLNRTSGAALLAAAGLLVAACGSSASNSHSNSNAIKSSPGRLQLSTAKGAAGTYLTDGSGRALYLWKADSGARSSCTGSCAQEWPPLIVNAAPSAGTGIQGGHVTTVARPGGGKQLTYKGHPLYYFAGDSGPGQTAGQGSDDFGAKWWLVAPSGAAITKAAASSDGSDAGGGWS
jgi:predicted lipoprotein with Yx(FWY)xxD motif